MPTREELEASVEAAQKSLSVALTHLQNFKDSAENNVFESLEDALPAIEEDLKEQAGEDCEGSYNVGNDTYTKRFMVGGQTYEGRLACEYGRHDKTYYFLDYSTFTYTTI